MPGRLVHTIKHTTAMLLIIGLLFSSGLFSVLLYAKISGHEWFDEGMYLLVLHAGQVPVPPDQARTGGDIQLIPEKETHVKQASAMLDAPAISQMPELPSGCELVAATMLLQYYGINKDKMELLPEMKVDPTPMKAQGGVIQFWGHPNTGYVGDPTRRTGSGFGIYHAPLYELLHSYIPTAVDMTGQPFDDLELQVSQGIPVVVWTTTNFELPANWVEWDTPVGMLRTTFSEHAVLLVGYDEQNVYVNDPLTGNKQMRIDKKKFMSTWEAMGKQALSYTN